MLYVRELVICKYITLLLTHTHNERGKKGGGGGKRERGERERYDTRL